jgi:gluconate 5-dehydrogenase
MLVNNAGIGMRTVNPSFMSHPLPFWEVRPEGFRDVVDTKVVGCFLVARFVVPIMLEADGGRIVNISMNESTMVRRGFAPYGPAGAGVEALSQIMAADLEGTPISVNTLLPGGATRTGMVPSRIICWIRQSWDRRSSGLLLLLLEVFTVNESLLRSMWAHRARGGRVAGHRVRGRGRAE